MTVSGQRAESPLAAAHLDSMRAASSLNPNGTLSPSSTARLAQGMLLAVPPPKPPPLPSGAVLAERPPTILENQRFQAGNSYVNVLEQHRMPAGGAGRQSILSDLWHQQQINNSIGAQTLPLQSVEMMGQLGPPGGNAFLPASYPNNQFRMGGVSHPGGIPSSPDSIPGRHVPTATLPVSSPAGGAAKPAARDRSIEETPHGYVSGNFS
eukprot:scaffold121171_cov42-Prasinocladus_malaysianus.AAC.2